MRPHRDVASNSARVTRCSAGDERRAGRKIEHVHEVGGGREEALAIVCRNRCRVGQGYGLRILVDAANSILVVQMRAGGEARHANVADDLAELDTLTPPQLGSESRQVPIY